MADGAGGVPGPLSEGAGDPPEDPDVTIDRQGRSIAPSTLDPLRGEILAWLREDRSTSTEAITRRLASHDPEVGEETVRRIVAELQRLLPPLGDSEGDLAGEPASEVRTPADPSPQPVPDEDGVLDLRRPGFFLNRELTWLNFNFRVLREADDERTPLLERVRFLAIVSSNLDEFFMKRIGGLKQQVGAGLDRTTCDGRTPQAQIDECYGLIHELSRRRRRILRQLTHLLREEGIELCSHDELSVAQQIALRRIYIDRYHPLITPQATDPAHPFPFISNLSPNLLVTLRYPGELELRLARVKLPVGPGVPRFVKLDDSDTFVPLESVIEGNLDLLFPGMVVEHVEMFRVTRNANTERDEESADDLIALIERELRDRKFAPVVRLQVSEGMSVRHRGMLAAELGLDEHADVFFVEGMMGMSDLMEFARLPRPDLTDRPHYPADHPELLSDRNIFHLVRDAGSLLLHHPYTSFTSSIERFLAEASSDPKVRAIKICLYRTSADTPVVDYLIDAAQNGKQVTVVVELKARFDEAANIRWANRLEEARINVTYGVMGLKTHCKVIQVVRQDFDGLRRYLHFGTGNYHAGTARVYSDLGLFTCDRRLGEDLTELLNYLTTGYKLRRSYAKLLPAPKLCRQALLKKIEREIELSTPSSPGLIQFKTNALEDPEIVRALYRASMGGVQVDLLVRDTCRLRPGIEGLSENVRVVSIIGRFLEHSRVYHFRNGGDEELFIGSADLMRRNLNDRVEVLVPIEEQSLREDLKMFLELQLTDPRCAWDMQPDGSYVQRRPEGDSGASSARGCQDRLIDLHQKREKKKTRLKRRHPRGLDRPRTPSPG
jgi:polyphosphate kinase